ITILPAVNSIIAMVNWLPDKRWLSILAVILLPIPEKLKRRVLRRVSLQSNQVILIITTVRFMLAMLA
ncbi:hypothetical protein AZ035_000704, partial [Klebsiella aerogenes]